MKTPAVTQLAPAASAFIEQVLARDPHTAVFDCDGTLWASNSGTGFMEWELARGLLPGPAADQLRRRYAMYLRGEVGEIAMCGEMVSCHAGLKEAEMHAAAEEFVAEQVRPGIFPEMQELVRLLANQHCDLWAVSSTATWVVRAGLRDFAIPSDHVLGVEISTMGGVIGHELLAIPSDERKAEALVRAGIPHPDAVFGNSMHDLNMLEIAREAYAVHPFADLRAIAAARGWTIYPPMI